MQAPRAMLMGRNGKCRVPGLVVPLVVALRILRTRSGMEEAGNARQVQQRPGVCLYLGWTLGPCVHVFLRGPLCLSPHCSISASGSSWHCRLRTIG